MQPWPPFHGYAVPCRGPVRIRPPATSIASCASCFQESKALLFFRVEAGVPFFARASLGFSGPDSRTWTCFASGNLQYR
jgi:hypothetical protein